MKSHTIATSTAAALALALTLPAHAEIAQLNFSGLITSIDGDFSGTTFADMTLGDAWSWTYSFETTTPDTQPSAELGIYDDPFVSSMLTVGANSTSSIGTNQSITTTNNHIFFNDHYIAELFDVDNNLGVELTLNDPTGIAHSSDAMLTSVNLDNYATRTFIITGPNGAIAEGSILVPAPGAALLLGTAALLRTNRRRQR